MMHSETQNGFFGAGCNSLPAVQSAKKCAVHISRSGEIPEPTVNGDSAKVRMREEQSRTPYMHVIAPDAKSHQGHFTT